MPREFNTDSRKDWNSPIHHILKAIDNHNMEYFRSGNEWHLKKAEILRTYLHELKTWIKQKEKQ